MSAGAEENQARDHARRVLGAVAGAVSKAYCAVPQDGAGAETFSGPFDAEHLHVVRAVLGEVLRDVPQLTYEFGPHRTAPQTACVLTLRWTERATRGEAACSRK